MGHFNEAKLLSKYCPSRLPLSILRGRPHYSVPEGGFSQCIRVSDGVTIRLHRQKI